MFNNDFLFSVFEKRGFARFQAATLLTEAMACLQPLSHGMSAAFGRAMRLWFSAGGALDAHAACRSAATVHPTASEPDISNLPSGPYSQMRCSEGHLYSTGKPQGPQALLHR